MKCLKLASKSQLCLFFGRTKVSLKALVLFMTFSIYSSTGYADEAFLLCRAFLSDQEAIACVGVKSQNVTAVKRCTYQVGPQSSVACIGVTDSSLAAVVWCVRYKPTAAECAGFKWPAY